jgi:hypothetical protein
MAAVAVAALVAAAVFLGVTLIKGRSADSTGASQGSLGSVQTAQNSGGGATGQKSGSPVDQSRVGPLRPVSVTAACTAPPGVDAAGNPVTYDAQLTLDGVGATAWRCAGSAVGQRLVFDFGKRVTLASVGLVPGYAKVDPVDGTNRFAENRTVTAANWHFDNGTTQRQTIAAPAPTAATLQLSSGVETTKVVLEIVGTGNDTAVRDFTAISDVVFTGY